MALLLGCFPLPSLPSPSTYLSIRYNVTGEGHFLDCLHLQVCFHLLSLSMRRLCMVLVGVLLWEGEGGESKESG